MSYKVVVSVKSYTDDFMNQDHSIVDVTSSDFDVHKEKVFRLNSAVTQAVFAEMDKLANEASVAIKGKKGA